MSDRVQIGPNVDAALWKRFRENIKDRKGAVRGNLGDELETAIRQYLEDGTDPDLKKANRRLARIEQELGIAHADGGAETLDAEPHTHAPTQPTVDEKPAPNAATDKKVAYLAGCVLDEMNVQEGDLRATEYDTLREVVKDEYGFRRDTAARYVDRLVDHFDLREHPEDSDLLLSTERYREIVERRTEQRREQAEADADETFGDTNA